MKQYSLKHQSALRSGLSMKHDSLCTILVARPPLFRVLCTHQLLAARACMRGATFRVAMRI